jgi:hypothetical protein
MSSAITRLDEQAAMRFARIAMENVVREYPNHIMHMLNSDVDVLSPRKLHPAFYGSYDWHSSVHSHWLLVRVSRLFPRAGVAPQIRDLLDRHLTAENLGVECAYFVQPHRANFERPYGLAWLLQLVAELHQWHVADARRWRELLIPLEKLAITRFIEWLPKLTFPVRSGEHAQTAFALGMSLDCARITGYSEFANLLESRSRDFYLHDTNSPIGYEPSGHDFLSPSLAEADLMRRVLPREDFAQWLGSFLPQVPENAVTGWLRPVMSGDQSDGKFAHLDGLNISRAWMCEGIASTLPENDARRDALMATAEEHSAAGLAGIREELYAGSHWLPSFAVYLLTRRGIE